MKKYYLESRRMFKNADSPRRCQPIHWLAGITVFVGVIMVLVAHGHYTVDVLIAYYVTTRLWYIYHTLANNSHLKVSCIVLLNSLYFYVRKKVKKRNRQR